MQTAANISTGEIQTLIEGLQFPEGPAFSMDGTLWAVELKGAGIIELKDGRFVRHRVGGMPNGLAISIDGNIFFCDSGQMSIRSFHPATHVATTIATHIDGEPLDKPNDLAFDDNGNLVFTCPGESRREATGYACVLVNDGSLRKITTGKFFPNGVAFTHDRKHLLIAETYKHRIWKGKWNSTTAEWTEEKVWCETGGPFGPGGPDGMAFDTEGNLFVAVYGTGKVKVISKAGAIVREIPLPGLNPTNCAFDPRQKARLIITEAEKGTILSLDLR